MSPSRSTDCVLVTRFNLPTPGVESLVRAQDNWLRNRMELFERYCVPSVRAQRDTDFRWIVYLDPQSPPWLRERLEPMISAGTFVPVFRERVELPELLADLQTYGRAGEQRPDVITANLDNDDAIGVDFVARLRAAPVGGGSTALFFGNGLVRDASTLYLRRDPSNAFRAVRDPWDAPATCWRDWHTRLHVHMPVLVLDGAPAWLQVVHGQNVTNRVRGRVVAASRYRTFFPGVLDDLADPRPRELLRDLLVRRPFRAVRDVARGGVKRVALGVLGKDGFDRVKHAARRLRTRR